MKPDAILRADLLDIVFENRNKAYGAYALRRGYNRRLWTALCCVPVSLLIFLFIMNIEAKEDQKKPPVFESVKDDYKLKQVELPKPVTPEQTVVTVPTTATVKHSTPLIVPDEVKTFSLPSVDELMKNKGIGLENIDGPPTVTTLSLPSLPAGNGAIAGEAGAEKEKVLTFSAIMPEFPGGINALRRFLGRNLRVPEQVMGPGQRVCLPVRFVVGREGLLSDVEFLVQVDEAFRKEVLRVLNKMPAWKPGCQEGKPVAVYFVIPIIFEMPGDMPG